VQNVKGKPKIAKAVGKADDLTRIKGIGPKLNDLCHSLGVKRFDQIAAWKKADVKEVDQYLKIKGRIDRDEWVKQAKLLAAGKDKEHEKKYAMKS
jgi:predicted flap endonuclease-1-like 5' DNA nuclease